MVGQQTSEPYRGRMACNSCGPNGLGCVRRAKGSVDLTYLPEAIRNGAEIVTGARVFEITTGINGRATGARYIDSQGAVHEQDERAVIVAANGIGTPRLLKLSTSDSHPKGLANRPAWIGKTEKREFTPEQLADHVLQMLIDTAEKAQ